MKSVELVLEKLGEILGKSWRNDLSLQEIFSIWNTVASLILKICSVCVCVCVCVKFFVMKVTLTREPKEVSTVDSVSAYNILKFPVNDCENGKKTSIARWYVTTIQKCFIKRILYRTFLIILVKCDTKTYV